MQQFINSCINANGAWPLVALAVLLIGFVLNRRVKSGLLMNNATQANTVSVKGNASAPITAQNTNTQTAAAPPSSAMGGSSLSTIADVLQVIGFAILLLQIFKVIT